MWCWPSSSSWSWPAIRTGRASIGERLGPGPTWPSWPRSWGSARTDGRPPAAPARIDVPPLPPYGGAPLLQNINRVSGDTQERVMHIDGYVALAGLIVGFTVGLTGMGGGALMTPILVLFFNVQPLAAVSSDLVAAMVMKPVGGGVHVRRGTVNWELVKWLCI